jgi:hypothetical protein
MIAARDSAMRLKIVTFLAFASALVFGQLHVEEFDGTSLAPQWQGFANGGSITVSGGKLRLANPTSFFPYVRTVPGLLTTASTRWRVEVTMAYPTIGGCGTKFAASHNPVVNQASCAGEPWLAESPVFVNHDGGAAIATHIKAGGSALMSIGVTDTGPHTYRWDSNGIAVSFFLDGMFVFAGPYDGHNPNNVWIGNSCPINCGSGWSTEDVDRIVLMLGPELGGPGSAAIGGAIAYTLFVGPPGTQYVFDVATTGSSPGVAVGPHQIPLNPPLLNTELGASIPQGTFVNFMGVANAGGFASASINVPPLPWLDGTNVSACFVSLNALAPLSIAGVANGVTTSLFVPLVLTQVSPVSVAAGGAIVVTGSGFLPGATVSIGGVAAQVTSVTPTSVSCINPGGISCDTTITVTNPSGQSGSLPFNPKPTITGVSGASGPAVGGAIFIVSGSAFHAGTTVTVGGQPATINFQSTTVLACTTPPGAPGQAAIVVSLAGGCSASSTYTYN